MAIDGDTRMTSRSAPLSGTAIVSSLLLSDDPVCRKFYGNVIDRLRRRAAGEGIEYRWKPTD